ncbi:uncharacterized protein PV06_08190 [Exophiala oligosperma]|uniref:Alcohol dehydrogenase-like N-terminal domain-containing protein n=1 Tax=Exophiala oligosperma TaxID=215243 RepID=A0A0D2AHJ5_9EURO|nr:uncharacterized protein PV06_08190 [Exophiala oligosperma]KIW39591.1 hypothetical protein PV06_08190 [Exophiala oligosperma]
MGVLQFFSFVGSSSPSKSIAAPILLSDPEKLPNPSDSVGPQQRVLLLHGPKQRYVEVTDHPTPSISSNRELLVRNIAIGLNPIDWKAPDFNFGIPELPYISGRELVGEVAICSRRKSRFNPGDKVIVISTDYRDLRKAAYQQYVVATDFNAARLPLNITPEAGSALGVAFVAAALCLGICAGVDFTSVANGPDLFSMVRKLQATRLPADIKTECLEGIDEVSRAKKGDWIAVWGGSSTSAFMLNQLARLVGLKTIVAIDHRKHALKIASTVPAAQPDIVVDSHDPQRAIEIVRSATEKRLRFAADTVGKDTATHLLDCLQQRNALDDEPLSTTTQGDLLSSHLIGLSGLPKASPPSNVAFHNVPIKLFHEIPEVGESLMLWLERLLGQGLLVPPTVLGVQEGFGSINHALDSMRRGEVSGGRLVVRVS